MFVSFAVVSQLLPIVVDIDMVAGWALRWTRIQFIRFVSLVALFIVSFLCSHKSHTILYRVACPLNKKIALSRFG